MTGRSLLFPALLLASSLPVSAQTASPPPHLSVLDGRATLTRGQDREDAVANTPLALGDRLATEYGRAEVLMGDGTALHLDESTTVDLNGDSVVRLLSGRLIVLATTASSGRLQIDTAAASVRAITAGEYHIAVVDEGGQPVTRVAVVRGEVDVDSELGRMPVIAGRSVVVREGEAPGSPHPFNSARADAFVEWSENLVDGRRGSTSAQYLPADVKVYGATFDQYGSWSYVAPYGHVWYPRVAHTWRPYYYGRWRYGVGFGWTFVGHNPWGWATHHYGRWGLSSAGAWFWIPTPGWGSAWVQWGAAPGYVGWCPLGWNNRPVIGWGHHPAPHRGHWRAWSVVPAHAFRGGVPVHHQRFDPKPFSGPRAPVFVTQPTPPASAIPRGAVVSPAYRVAGPSVAPRGDQSRRGPASSSLASSAGGTRRGAAAPAAPAAAGSSRTGGRAGAVAPAAGSAATGVTAPAAGAVTRSPRPGPPVVYYRGGARSEPDRSGVEAYERAGVAVPRGLPADAGSAAAPAGDRGRVASPYGESRSPYSRDRGGEHGGATVTRPGDHPDYAVPRGTPRGGNVPDYTPRSEPRQPPPEPRAASPQPDSGRSRQAAGPPSDSGRSRQAAPPPSSRGDGGPRASSPPPSRGQAAAPAARSGGGRGGSMGTAVPRRR